MADITLRDLQDMRTGITTDLRYDLSRVEKSIGDRLDDMHADADRRLTELKTTQDDHARQLGSLGLALAGLQAKASKRWTDLPKWARRLIYGLVTLLAGGSVEGLRHLATALLTLLAGAHS